ncbi:MAG: LuxR C-terminal-related transcriptional regulator, partial [Actinomycetaceae bacterium]
SLFWRSELDAVLTALADRAQAGVIVVGGPGAGKTTLVRAALQHAEAPPSIVLQCGAALVDVPYGALSPFLTDLQEIRGPVDALAAVQHHLDAIRAQAADGAGTRPVIVVEDCQFLDAGSAFVLALLAQNNEAVLLTTSVGLRGGTGMGALVDTGLLSTVTIPPLGEERTRALCAALVGGAPTDGAVATVLGMTGGSPRLTTAFVASALDQEIVVRERGAWAGVDDDAPWTLLRPMPAVDERLSGIVGAMHAELTDRQRDAVTVLALAGRLTQAQVRDLVGEQAEDLASSYLTRTDPDGTVRLSAELYGEVLRSITTARRRSTLRTRWSGAFAPGEQAPSARAVEWVLDDGGEVPLAHLLAAGYEHLADGDVAAAANIVEVAHLRAAEGREGHEGIGESAAPDPTAAHALERLALLRGEVMLATARTWSGRAELVEVADSTDDPELVVEAMAVLAADQVHSGRSATPVDALREVARERADRLGGRAPVPPGADGTTASWWQALDGLDEPGGRARLLELSSELVGDLSTSEALRFLAHLTRVRVHLRRGAVVEAVASARTAHDLATGSRRMTALLGGYCTVYLVLVLIAVGDLDAAQEELDRLRTAPVHRRHRWSGTTGALQGILHVVAGRPRRARAGLRGAALDLRQWDPAHLGPLVEVLRAYVAGAAHGGLVERLRAAGPSGPADVALLALAVAGLVDDEAAGRTTPDPTTPDPTTPGWRRVAEDPAMDGFPVIRFQALLLALVARRSEEDQRPLLAALHAAAGRVDGLRADLVVAMTDPSAVEDAVRLADLAARARAVGDHLLAADSWARVVHLYDRGNDLRRRGEALRHTQDVVLELGGAPGRYVRSALELGALSEREREISLLAQQGLRTADIAARLVVSPRTVEGHLYRVFNKLGISDRSELRALRL